MSENKNLPSCRESDIVVQELENETLVYDLLKNKAYCLNKTSAVIWQACNGKRNIDGIAKVSSNKLNSKITSEMVWLALEQFRKDNLLEKKINITDNFDGMSRREVIRKVGMSSLIALPIVSTIVAPMAVQAQSACAGACQCPNPTVNFCSPAAGGMTLDCNTLPPQSNPAPMNCRCRGPFGAPGSGTSPGQKTGNCSV